MSAPASPKTKSRRVALALSAVAIGAIVLAASGLADRARSRQEVANWTNEQAIPSVRLVKADRGPIDQDLVLPGNVSAYYAGSLFARASGYIASWSKDIGAHVSKGEVLAVISAPDLDKQLEEARAQLSQMQATVDQAQANADLAKATNTRTTQLVAQGWTSKEQGDTDHLTAVARAAAVEVARANAVSQQAVVDRLQELVGFEQIRAPFDGVVTARNVDIGDLVNAGGTTGRALFQVADIHRVRVYVNVPQGFLGELAPGVHATLRLPGIKETFEAEMASTSNSLAESSRTALIELQADNTDGKLWPGAFAEVHFHIPADVNALSVPLTALVFGQRGMQVAVLDDSSGRVTLKSVRLGRNLGNKVEIESGVSLSDRLVDNPPESMQTGDQVRLAATDAAGPSTASNANAGPTPVKND